MNSFYKNNEEVRWTAESKIVALIALEKTFMMLRIAGESTEFAIIVRNLEDGWLTGGGEERVVRADSTNTGSNRTQVYDKQSLIERH